MDLRGGSDSLAQSSEVAGLGGFLLYTSGLSLGATALSLVGVFGGESIYRKYKGIKKDSGTAFPGGLGGVIKLIGMLAISEIGFTALLVNFTRSLFIPQSLVFMLPIKGLTYYIVAKQLD